MVAFGVYDLLEDFYFLSIFFFFLTWVIAINYYDIFKNTTGRSPIHLWENTNVIKFLFPAPVKMDDEMILKLC